MGLGREDAIAVLPSSGTSNFKGVLASEPLTAVNGDYYINSVDNKEYTYYNSQWYETFQYGAGTADWTPMGLLLAITHAP